MPTIFDIMDLMDQWKYVQQMYWIRIVYNVPITE